MLARDILTNIDTPHAFEPSQVSPLRLLTSPKMKKTRVKTRRRRMAILSKMKSKGTPGPRKISYLAGS